MPQSGVLIWLPLRARIACHRWVSPTLPPAFAIALLAALLAVAPAAQAQDAEPAPLTERDANRAELERLTRDIFVSEERQAEIRREIEGLEGDRARLSETLIDTGKRVQALEGQLDAAERRLDSLRADEGRLRSSLQRRRAVLGEVLAALQRIGRSPPPAILIRPDDALGSVRSAILLGAVLPDLSGDARRVAEDLDALIVLREQQFKERERLMADAGRLAEERNRLELLIDERQRAQTRSEAELAAVQKRAEELAAEASTLRELIDGVEAAISEAAPDAVPIPEAERIGPAIAFADARRTLPRPASGEEVVRFGADDGFGGRSQGVSILTRPDARVSTPADGRVVYAGPFRSYGNLLIINAGGGYHVLLAGMDRIDVEVGQFVLAGEPVAAMGARRLADASANVGASQPVLYVEFRKDGTSVDPGPWWARPNDEKVGG